jgi:UPF0042 nucleotide-binding protein
LSEDNKTATGIPFSVVVIAGTRASGRTLSLRLLEDLGYKGIDNLPPSVIPHLVASSLEEKADESLVVVSETRTPSSAAELVDAIEKLRAMPVPSKVVFLDASDTALLDRLGFASRNHRPDAEVHAVQAELAADRERAADLKACADIVLDTSRVTPIDLKERLAVAIDGQSLSRTMSIEVHSFGFKYARFSGDLVFDVRFIPNPYYVSELRPLTGRDAACARFVFETPEARLFVDTITELVAKLVPAYIAQGRSRLRIGIGCTGGHHRSVAVAEALAASLTPVVGSVELHHRELHT